jgi:hypothetical protein
MSVRTAGAATRHSTTGSCGHSRPQPLPSRPDAPPKNLRITSCGQAGRSQGREGDYRARHLTITRTMAVGMDAPALDGWTPTRTPGRTATQCGLSRSSFVLPGQPARMDNCRRPEERVRPCGRSRWPSVLVSARARPAGQARCPSWSAVRAGVRMGVRLTVREHPSRPPVVPGRCRRTV